MAIAKKLTASAIASSLLLAIAGPAFAADLTVDQVAQKMFDLGIVKGNGSDLNLTGTLTRAELITTIVRSFGLEQAALLAKGAPSFADVSATEWYSGWVAVAKNLAETKGVKLGVTANTFNPNGQLSKAEALVFVMKFLGINVQATATGNWYDAWINEAVARGIITEAQGADIAATATAKSTRGEAFVVIDAGYSYKDAAGKSLYTTNIDSVKPELNLTVAPTTTESKVTLAGTATDNKGVASVVINGQQVTLTNGAFSVEAELAVGTNKIDVVVTDLAGNTFTKTYEIARGNVDAASIEASDVTVVAGATATVEAKLVDKNGEAIANAAITGTSTLGTFENGVFTAGTKAGEGTLTLKSGDITKTINVKVEAGELAKVTTTANIGIKESATLVAQDQYGNVIEGATFSSSDAFINGNSFIATEAGAYTVTATKGDKNITSTINVYGDVAAFKVEAPTSVVANGQTEYTVTVKAVDAAGNFVANYGTAIAVPTFNGATNVAAKNVQMKNGVATFVYTVNTGAANTRLTVSAVAGTIKGSAAVDAVTAVATSIELNTDTNFLPTNSRTEGQTVTINVLDQAGMPFTTAAWPADITITGPATTDVGTTVKTLSKTVATGANTFVVYPEFAGADGQVDISVSVAGLTTGTKTLKAQYAYAPANVSFVATGETAQAVVDVTGTPATSLEYKAILTDRNGVPVKAGAATNVTLTVTGAADKAKVKLFDGSTWTDLNGTTTLTFGATEGTKTFRIAGAKAETLSITGTATGLTVGTATATFNTGAAAVVELATGTNLNVLRGATNEVTLTATVKDGLGNVVKAAGKEVTFSVANYDGITLNGKGENAVVKTDANGQASVTVNIANYLNGAAVTAAFGTSSDSTTIALQSTIASSLTLDVLNANGYASTFVSGEGSDLTLRVAVKDNYGRPVASLADSAFTVTDSSANVTLPALDWTESSTEAGVYTATVTGTVNVLKTAEAVSIKVQIANLQSEVADSKSVTVVPGATAATVRVTEAAMTSATAADLDVAANTVKAITIQLADVNGNVISPVANTANKAITVGTTGGVEVRNADGLALGNTATIAAGRNSITLYVIDGNEAGTVTLQLGAGYTLTLNLK